MLPAELNRENLTEIIDQAFARAASSLFELTGCRVLLDAKRMTFLETDELAGELGDFAGSRLAAVHQAISGPASGEAFLLLNYDDTAHLLELLTEEKSLTNQLNESDQEALTEVGNLLLDVCLSALGNLLEDRIMFSSPRLLLENLECLLDRFATGKEDGRRALVVRVSFGLRDHLLNGCLVMTLRLDSPDVLAQAIERRGEAQIEV